MMLNNVFKKSYVLSLILSIVWIFLDSQNVNAHEKIFELDLTDEGLSTEGGGIELRKYKDYCILSLNLYGELGQDKYKFKFKKDTLIKTDYFEYRYKKGLLVVDDDLKDLIASSNDNSGDTHDMQLMKEKLFNGGKNKDIVKKFYMYKKKIPFLILNKNCT